jgi:type IV pilus assembly protein PilA
MPHTNLFSTASTRSGFTLVELLVVILVIAVLLVVALPSFLGTTNLAYASKTEQQLAVTRIEAKALWTADGQQGFPYDSSNTAVVQALSSSEPSYSFVGDSSGDAATESAIGISVDPDDHNILTACSQTHTGAFICFRSDEESSLMALTSTADASSTPTATTDVARASGATEAAAICVLDDATPVSAGGDWSSDWSGCEAQGGTDGWTTTPATSTDATPSNTTSPTVMAIALPDYQGSVLVMESTYLTDTGTWNGDPAAFSYQWLSCADSAGIACSSIPGATSSTYSEAPEGGYYEVAVTATNSAGSQTAISQPVANPLQIPNP